MKRIVWLFVVEHSVSEYRPILEHLLQFINHRPNNSLLVFAINGQLDIVYNGPPGFNALKKVHESLRVKREPGSFHLGVPKILGHLRRIVGANSFDLHYSFITDLELTEVPTQYRFTLSDELQQKNQSFSCSVNSTALAIATLDWSCLWHIGEDLAFKVEGYRPVQETGGISYHHYHENMRVSEINRTLPASDRYIQYGSTFIPLDKTLQQRLLANKLCPHTKLDLHGFIDEPPVFIRSCPTILRYEHENEICCAIVASMKRANKVGLARFQRGQDISMVCLTPLEGEILMETLVYSDSVSHEQFPPLEVLPSTPWDEQIRGLEPVSELKLELELTSRTIYDVVLDTFLSQT